MVTHIIFALAFDGITLRKANIVIHDLRDFPFNGGYRAGALPACNLTTGRESCVRVERPA